MGRHLQVSFGSDYIRSYGTLKEGFCNFKLNQGRRIPGDFVTVEFFQLYVLGPLSLSWMVAANGQGFK